MSACMITWFPDPVCIWYFSVEAFFYNFYAVFLYFGDVRHQSINFSKNTGRLSDDSFLVWIKKVQNHGEMKYKLF